MVGYLGKNIMNNKSLNPPDWWLHTFYAWSDLVYFFSQPKKQEYDTTNPPDIYNAKLWKLVPGGESHTNYQLSFGQKKFFVQIYSQQNTRLQPQLNIKSLYTKLAQLNAITPWLVECLYETSYLKIDRWFENTGKQHPEIGHNLFTESLIEFLCQLHQLQIDAPPEQDDLADRAVNQLPKINIQEYIARYQQQALHHKPSHCDAINTITEQAAQFIPDFLASTFCHNDLSFNNILWSADQKLKIIDWEYCGFSDRYFELANLISACQMDSQQEKRFLNKYSNKVNIIIDLEKLKKMKQLASCINQLWYYAADKLLLKI